MKVLHFRRSFPELSETFIRDSVDQQKRCGLVPQVLALTRTRTENLLPYEVYESPTLSRSSPFRILSRSLTSLGMGDLEDHIQRVFRPGLEEVLLRVEPHLIHAHFGPDAVLIMPLAAKLEIPLIATFYGYDISRSATIARFKRDYQRLWTVASKIIVLSENMLEKLALHGCPRSKLEVVHLGKELERYPFQRPRVPIRRFISVGRLTEKKNHSAVIEAFRCLKEIRPDLRLTIIGGGESEGRIRRTIEDYEMNDRIKLLGPMEHEDVIHHLTASDAFILCSRKAADGDEEGTPTVLLEAQAIGLPCISTSHSGIPETIPETNHWLLADQNEPATIVERIGQLLERTPEEISELARRGRHHIEQHFDLAKVTKRLIRIYRETAENCFTAINLEHRSKENSLL